MYNRYLFELKKFFGSCIPFPLLFPFVTIWFIVGTGGRGVGDTCLPIYTGKKGRTVLTCAKRNRRRRIDEISRRRRLRRRRLLWLKSPPPLWRQPTKRKMRNSIWRLGIRQVFLLKKCAIGKKTRFFCFWWREVWTTVCIDKNTSKQTAKQKMSLTFRSRDLGTLLVFFCKKNRDTSFFSTPTFHPPTFLMGKSFFLPPCTKGTIKMRRQSYHPDSSHIRLQTAAPKRHLSWYLPRNWKSKRPPTSFRYRITCCTTNPFPLLFLHDVFFLPRRPFSRKEGRKEQKKNPLLMTWVEFGGGFVLREGEMGGTRRGKKIVHIF